MRMMNQNVSLPVQKSKRWMTPNLKTMMTQNRTSLQMTRKTIKSLSQLLRAVHVTVTMTPMNLPHVLPDVQHVQHAVVNQ